VDSQIKDVKVQISKLQADDMPKIDDEGFCDVKQP